MEKWDTGLLQQPCSTEHTCNLVELDARREIRRQVHTLIDLATYTPTSTSEIRQRLSECTTRFGSPFATHLVRSLQQYDDEDERQSLVWLLTVLNDAATIPQLQHIVLNERLSRSIRLAASLALAGMNATHEVTSPSRSKHLYAI